MNITIYIAKNIVNYGSPLPIILVGKNTWASFQNKKLIHQIVLPPVKKFYI